MKKHFLLAYILAATTITVKAQLLETNKVTDWNSLKKSGFYESFTSSSQNNPGGYGWYWGINVGHTSNGAAPVYNYNGQILFAVNPSAGIPKVYVRSTNQSGSGVWAKLLHDQGDQNINGRLTVNEGLRIGKIGDGGTQTIPVGAIAKQLNLDFTGFRDNGTATDQIGARVAAVRYNNYLADKAFIQKTGLVFYTNPSGYEPGTTDLVERMRISPEGNIGIGTTNPQNKLDINGTIRAKEIKVETGWADFVFEKNYNLPSLSDVENHINTHKRLPEIPSEAEVKENGVNLGEMQVKLLQKIEELTLYIIQQNKRIDELEKTQLNK